MSRRAAIAVLAVILAIAATLAVKSVRMDSPTTDEPAYIATGFIKLLHGRLDFFRDQPPLMNSIAVVPLVVTGHELRPGWRLDSNQWELGREFLYRSGYNGDRALFLARIPTLLMFLALLVVMYVFVARETESRGWALVAVALTAFCPNLMAHGRLATVDLANAFFSFTSVVLLLRMIAKPSFVTAAGLGVFSAAAILTKASSNILGPFFVIVLLLAFITRRVSSPRRVLACFAVAIVVATVAASALILIEASDEYVAYNFPRLTTWPARLLVPFAEYRANLQTISDWYRFGHKLPQFLLGKFSYRGWRHYYAVAFALKTTIPALLLIVAAIGVAVVRRRAPGDTRAPSFAALISALFALIFLGVASAGDLNLGIRYVLLVYPFIYAATAISLSGITKRGLLIATGVLLAWHVAENVRAYPSYISYFNELIGSHRNADRYLIDSNLDWGQDLKRLGRWAGGQDIPVIYVHYAGGGDVGYEFRGTKADVRQMWAFPKENLPSGYLALSRHFYRLSFHGGTTPMNYDALFVMSGAEYVTTIGGSIDVYRIP